LRILHQNINLELVPQSLPKGKGSNPEKIVNRE
jgi:hypothetical protein